MNLQAPLIPASGFQEILAAAPAIFAQAAAPTAVLEGESHVVAYANPAFCRLMERAESELGGKPFAENVPGMAHCIQVLSRVYRLEKSESYTQAESSPHQAGFESFTAWPVIIGRRSGGVIMQITESARLRARVVAVNEALILGSVRQHELTDSAEKLNLQLSAEIAERKQATERLHEIQAELSDRAGQLESMIAERTKELTATNQQLESFIYSIAHDLRAPLRSMQGFSVLLAENLGGTSNVHGRDFANRIAKSAKFMDAMLIDLLEFSRISQQEVKLTAVSMKSVLEGVVARAEKEIAEKGAVVEGISGAWPDVLAHEPTLKQVVANLLNNALTFVRAGVSPRIRLRGEERGAVYRVWIEDNGIGIAPEHQLQIFRLFIRLDGEKYPGTGFGLTIVQKGLERMGGSVGVESGLGQGSRFWFELPKA